VAQRFSDPREILRALLPKSPTKRGSLSHANQGSCAKDSFDGSVAKESEGYFANIHIYIRLRTFLQNNLRAICKKASSIVWLFYKKF